MQRDEKAPPDVSTLGGRLRKAREVAGLSQRTLAKETGISERQVIRIEVNEDFARPETSKIFADRLGVSHLWLRFGEGDMYATGASTN